MPCRSDEEEKQRPDSPAPVAPTKSLRNDGARHDNPEAENSSAESNDDYINQARFAFVFPFCFTARVKVVFDIFEQGCRLRSLIF